jgi:RND family efflux transporter MFP subunit
MEWVKNNKKKSIAGAILFAVLLFTIFGGGADEVAYDTVVAELQDLKQEINATGRIEAIRHIDLAFEKSGRVGSTNVSVGDKVVRGQVLLTLESAEASAELAQALASVESAKASLQQYEASLANQTAKLNELIVGVREEEVFLYESKVVSAETALSSAKDGAINAVADAYTRSEEAVRNTADQMFNSPKTSGASLKFTTTDSGLKNKVELSRVELESVLTLWKSDLSVLENTGDIDSSLSLAKLNLEKIKSFLEDMSSSLNNALTSGIVSQTTIDGWRASISLARTSINLAIANHSTAKEKLKNAETALVVAQNELALRKAPSTPEQISAQEAAVDQAKANIISQKAQIRLAESNVQAVEVRYAKNILRSPISGTVTKQDAKEGEIIAANQIVVSIISEGEFEIEAYIVEADIVGLEVGDMASLTLDAYGDDILFMATVVEIDPAAVQVEGVANYRITLKLSADDERIRAGMTADIDIVTDERESVIAIPQRAVIFKRDGKIVRTLNSGILSEVEVETGIRGERGLIEIVSGINEGDIVVTAVNE